MAPPIEPVVVGAKSTGRVQLAPAASVPAAADKETTGQVAELSIWKFAAMLGFCPEVRTGNVSGTRHVIDYRGYSAPIRDSISAQSAAYTRPGALLGAKDGKGARRWVIRSISLA